MSSETVTDGVDRFRRLVSVPFMLLSSVLLANAQVAARTGDRVSGEQWSVDTDTEQSER